MANVSTPSAEAPPTAACLIIGEEILSGRTKDANLPHLAAKLGEIGIPLSEARVVPDDVAMIGETLRALAGRYTYVFTTGGIGPTHDDRTAEAVALAFGTVLERNADALAVLKTHYPDESWLNEARLKMTEIPVGASLIDNPVSKAPGFRIENVFVMAGVPTIFQAMLEGVLPTLAGGPPIVQRSVVTTLHEGDVSADLATIQATHPTVAIGSYPRWRPGADPALALVARGPDAAAVDAALEALVALAKAHGQAPKVE